jgi:hypothetical protein
MVYGFGRARLGHAVRIALSACVATSALALSVSPALATEGKAPVIASTESGTGGGVTVSAQINPGDLETSYEIKLVCSSCAPAGYAPAAGTLPPANEARTVTLNLTGIQPGSYRFEVFAGNSAGDASQSGELYVPPSYLIEFNEAQAREQQEKQTAEAARHATEEAELKQADEREAQADEREAQEAVARERVAREHQRREEQEAEPLACRVPTLRGQTLAAARRALAKAHCSLGAVHRPGRHNSALYVRAQGTPTGKLLADNARVAVWLGAKRRSLER